MRISLTEALKAAAAGPGTEATAHVSRPEMYDLLRQPCAAVDHLLPHLASCPRCAHEMREMVESLALADIHLAGWDLALPKAAATADRASWRLSTEGGRYTIELRAHASSPGRGLLSVQVSPMFRDQLEGRWVNLKDSKGRLLLEGRIVGGEAVQEVTDLPQIDPCFVVRTD